MSEIKSNGNNTQGAQKAPTAALTAPATVIPAAGDKGKGFTERTPCPITRAVFESRAERSLRIQVGENIMTAERKEFSTGSFGWHASDKMTVRIDGKDVKVQVNLMFTVVGSKDAK